jgi:hypothetical protein
MGQIIVWCGLTGEARGLVGKQDCVAEIESGVRGIGWGGVDLKGGC